MAELFSLFTKHSRSVETEHKKAIAESKYVGPIRVLLVEDQADLADMMAELLRDEGLEVQIAFTGREALEAQTRFEPQLILCDLHLPDMNGVKVIRRLRSSPATGAAYAAIVTSLSEAEIRSYNSEAADLGVDEFIAKPVTQEVVRRLVAKLQPS
jgi:CheY-like chemotaxis protein